MQLLLILLVSTIIIDHGNGEKIKCFDSGKCENSYFENYGMCPTLDGFPLTKLTDTVGKNVTIKFQISESISQRIFSWMMKIYFNEVLGFDNIEMENIHTQFDNPDIGNRTRENEITINMETWIPTKTWDSRDLSEGKMFFEPTNPMGWIGWFRPSKFHDYDYRAMCKKPKFAEHLPLESEALSIIEKFTINGTNGLFIPDRCKENGNRCTIMLTSEFLLDDLIDEIKTEELFIKIYCVGSNLKHVTSLLLESYASIFFILRHWYPSELTYPEEQFSSIKSTPMKYFDGIISNKNPRLFTLHRVISNNSEHLAPIVPQAIKAFNFPLSDFLSLIKSLNRSSNTSDYEVACNLLKNGKSMAKSTKKLIVGVLLPTDYAEYDFGGLFEVMKFVKSAMDSNKFTKNYQLSFEVKNTSCLVFDEHLESFLNPKEYSNNLIGMVGPPCPHHLKKIEDNFLKSKTIAMTYSLENSDFHHRKVFPYYYRIIGYNRAHNYIYSHFFQHFDWRRVAILCDDEIDTVNSASQMTSKFHDFNITRVNKHVVNASESMMEIKEKLSDLVEKRAKIVIVHGFLPSIRLIICAAFQLNMTAKKGYVWFLPGWLGVDWWRANVTDKLFSCTSDNLFEVINGHFTIEQVQFGPDEQMMQENVTIGQWRKRYEEDSARPPLGKYAGFLYDACWVYVNAVKRLEIESPEVFDDLHGRGNQQLGQVISQSDFHGLSGRVRFDSVSRVVDYTVRQFIDNNHRTVGNTSPNTWDDIFFLLKKPNKNEKFLDRILTLNDSAIIWPSGSIPTDGREQPHQCTFEGLAKALKVTCEVATISMFFIIFISLGIPIAVGFIFFKRKYDEKIRVQKALIKSQTLLRPNDGGLDEWEIPRDRILIDRKIGEGAFGVVYGGDAYFPGSGWVSVAVKTLKPGSSTENESDFLSESDVMKKFDHPNIIKLLGVCIKSEPMQTVMEFMLYGDLRTYLLARKNLVKNQGHEMSEEIGYKRLTGMALDVVRALGYLDQLRYVHRDVACRNCLINVDRVVKLSDFGMTRSMYESDYYRFSRKGMFPVRWMAPESLSQGIFAPSSDIWSYGVLLYEIITFGKTPYRGKTNEQVVDHVKRGHTLPIPKGVKSSLKNLMNSCLMMDPTKRPTASEITATLVTNSCLLEPCLDARSSGPTKDFELPEELKREASILLPSRSILSEIVTEPSTPVLIIPDVNREMRMMSSINPNSELNDEHVELEDNPLQNLF